MSGAGETAERYRFEVLALAAYVPDTGWTVQVRKLN